MSSAYPALDPIGIVHSPFKEKFGIPRQPGLIPSVPGAIELLPPYAHVDAVRGLDGFSHIWVLFLLHAVPETHMKLTARPPRLGGNTRIGVFASRTTHRPNRIGQSVVRLDAIESTPEGVRLRISGHDLLDRTPVLDIKPYLPYADIVIDASSAYANAAPLDVLEVEWTAEAAHLAAEANQDAGWDLRGVIDAMLRLDPRPAYRAEQADASEYGMRVDRYDVRFEARANRVRVLTLRRDPD